MIRESGIEPVVIAYLYAMPPRYLLVQVIRDAQLSIRAAIRTTEPSYARLRLEDPLLTDADLLDALEAHPELLDRPFVVSPLGTRLCRPPEVVLEILPHRGIGNSVKTAGSGARAYVTVDPSATPGIGG